MNNNSSSLSNNSNNLSNPEGWFFSQEEALDIKMERAKQDKLRYMIEKYKKLFKKFELRKFFEKEAENACTGLVVKLTNKRLGLNKGHIKIRDKAIDNTLEFEYADIPYKIYIKTNNHGYLVFIWEKLDDQPDDYIITLPQYICKQRLNMRRYPRLVKDKDDKEVSYKLGSLIKCGLKVDRSIPTIDTSIENQ